MIPSPVRRGRIPARAGGGPTGRDERVMGWEHKPDGWVLDQHATPLYDQTKADIAARYPDDAPAGQAPPAEEQSPVAGVRVGTVSTVADVLAANGIIRAPEVVELAAAAGLDLAAAATMLQKESSGGRNVFGHDPGATVQGGDVTEVRYKTYLADVEAGRSGRQGVGPCQLTWSGYQDQADKLGGCWDWRCNITVGFTALAQGIKAHGLRSGFRAYNGAGPAAERYADDAMAKYNVWRAKLAGAPIGAPGHNGDDDLTPEQNAMLVAVYQYVSGSATVVPQGQPWPGWETWPGGSQQHLTATDYLRRNNVDMSEVLGILEKMQSDVASLKAKYAS